MVLRVVVEIVVDEPDRFDSVDHPKIERVTGHFVDPQRNKENPIL